MLIKKICKTCKTGREAVEIDSSGICPFILSYSNGKCSYYKKDKNASLIYKRIHK